MKKWIGHRMMKLVVACGLGLGMSGCVAYDDGYYAAPYNTGYSGGGYYGGGYYGGYGVTSVNVYAPRYRPDYRREQHHDRGGDRHQSHSTYRSGGHDGGYHHDRRPHDFRRD